MADRTEVLADLEADLKARLKARGQAEERARVLRAERGAVSANGVTAGKLAKIRDQLREAEAERVTADDSYHELLPDVQELRTVVAAQQKHERDIAAMERQVAAYEAQHAACQHLAKVAELLGPYHQGPHVGPTLAGVTRSVLTGRLVPDWVPSQVERTLQASRRQLADLKDGS